MRVSAYFTFRTGYKYVAEGEGCVWPRYQGKGADDANALTNFKSLQFIQLLLADCRAHHELQRMMGAKMLGSLPSYVFDGTHAVTRSRGSSAAQ